jgi:hypothetical protein
MTRLRLQNGGLLLLSEPTLHVINPTSDQVLANFRDRINSSGLNRINLLQPFIHADHRYTLAKL